MKLTWYYFKTFFINYFWLGICILLFSIILDLNFPTNTNKIFLTFLKLIEAVGVSVVIASIFTFASGTSQFVDRIKGLLKEIIVKRDFLANIDIDSKRDALKSLIQPSSSEKNKYPNIGDYYGYFIDKTLDIKDKSVRSNYAINARAYLCKGQKVITIEGVYTYRLYPNSKGFNDIVVGFEDPDSSCSSVTISDPSGTCKIFKNPVLEKHDEGGDISYRAHLSIQEFANGKNHIDVELQVVECGEDHWKMLQFKALQPTDGFRFRLHCEDNIQIQEHAIFVVGAKYQLAIDDKKKNISFSCNQWVNEGTGICVLVSIPDTSS